MLQTGLFGEALSHFLSISSLLSKCCARAQSAAPRFGFLTLVLLSFSAQIAISQRRCVFNATHCSCVHLPTEETCLQNQGNEICKVTSCHTKSLKCDCTGAALCKITYCDSWIPTIPLPISTLALGTTVSCEMTQTERCLHEDTRFVSGGSSTLSEGSLRPNLLQSPTIRPSPPPLPQSRESFLPLKHRRAPERVSTRPSSASSYSTFPLSITDYGHELHKGESLSAEIGLSQRQKRFTVNVRSSAEIVPMVAMKPFVDYEDVIADALNMHNRWPHPARLKHRFITIRSYCGEHNGSCMLCAIYNTYLVSDDGLGDLTVSTWITGPEREVLEWVTCDRAVACKNSKFSNMAFATHVLQNTETSGWCIPLRPDFTEVKVRFAGVNGMKGIVLQSVTRDETVKLFRDGFTNGVAGHIDSGGLVVDGVIPEMHFSMEEN